MNDRYEKWRRWMAAIYSEVVDVVVHRHIFTETVELVKAHSELRDRPSTFFQFMKSGYATLATTAVRRQGTSHKDSVSLLRLLKEMANTPEALTCARYKAAFPTWRTADEFFGRFADASGKKLDAAPIKRDAQRLQEAVQATVAYADQRVAHLDERSLRYEFTRPTYADLDGALEALEDLAKKYQRLLNGSVPDETLPTWQYDWMAIFDYSWRPQRCSAMTAKGVQCRRRPGPGNKMCSQHSQRGSIEQGQESNPRRCAGDGRGSTTDGA